MHNIIIIIIIIIQGLTGILSTLNSSAAFGRDPLLHIPTRTFKHTHRKMISMSNQIKITITSRIIIPINILTIIIIQYNTIQYNTIQYNRMEGWMEEVSYGNSKKLINMVNWGANPF